MQQSEPAAVEIIAHRGAGQGKIQPETPPENTLPAVAYAWSREVNADAAEVDIHLTRDGEIIVIHDATTKRTATANWVVEEHTLSELLTLDAGSWKAPQFGGVRLPTLEQVIATIPDGKRLFTEIKTGPRIVARLAQVMAGSGKAAGQLPLMSFDIDAILRAKQQLPAHECYLLVSFEHDDTNGQWLMKYDVGPDCRTVAKPADPAGLDALIELVERSGLDGIDTSFTHPRGLRERIRDHHLKSVVWTVNDVEVAREMIDGGIRSITTDLPRQMREALSR